MSSQDETNIRYLNEGCSDGLKAPRFQPKNYAEFSTKPLLTWIVKKIIPRSELVIIYGESGCGKSFMALALGMAIAREQDWHGHKTKLGRVVYVCAESPHGFRGRVRAYAMRHGLRDDDFINFQIIDDAPDFTKDGDPMAMAQQIGQADVIFIDTLARITAGGNENAGEDMGPVIARCQALHKATGALIVLIHHSGKTADKGSRGWSGLRAAADSEIFVEKTLNGHQATVTKQKDGPDNLSWGFTLPVYTLEVDEDGDEVTSCTYEPSDITPSQKAKTRKLGRWQETVMVTFEDTIKDESNSFILEAVLIDLCLQKVPTDDKSLKNDNRDQIRRALHALYNKKLLEKLGDKVIKSNA